MKNQKMKEIIFLFLMSSVSLVSGYQKVLPIVLAEKMDVNGDHKITIQEYYSFYDFDFKRRDRGDDGVLSAEEFTNTNLFRYGDRNNDGQLNRLEFKSIYKRRFPQYDINSDGVISDAEMEGVAACSTQTIIYADRNGKKLTLDVDLPSGEGPFPVVVWVHGGGWTSGDSSALVEFSKKMVLQGIAGVRINYRLANAVDKATLDEALSDVLTAIEWVRTNSEQYHFDMNHLGICGASAGGHLSALAAHRTPECSAYIGYCGGYDLLNRGSSSWPSNGLLSRYLGGIGEETLKANSPLWQIRRAPASALLLHGTSDKIIDSDIAVRYAAALRSHGGEVKLVLLDGAQHGICHQIQFKSQLLEESEAFLCRVFERAQK